MTTPPPEVHLISAARRAHSEDMDRRMKRYLISMAVRTVCVVLAVVVPGPLRWGFIAGAVILPYIAVVMANAVGEKRVRPVVARPQHAALPASSVTSTERVIQNSNESTV